MSSISDKLDIVIEKLDGMTSEIVEKNFDTTIASKIDHISRQLDYITAGSGSGSGANEVFEIVFDTTNHTSNKTYAETMAAIRDGKTIIARESGEQDGINSLRLKRYDSFTIYFEGFYYTFGDSEDPYILIVHEWGLNSSDIIDYRDASHYLENV